MPTYPSAIPSTTTIVRGSNQSGAGGGLAHTAYDDAVLTEVAEISTDLVGTGAAAGVKGSYGSLKERLDVENGRWYQANHSWSPAGASLAPTHNLGTRMVTVIIQRISDGLTIQPSYTSSDDNGITITAGDVSALNNGDAVRYLIRAL